MATAALSPCVKTAATNASTDKGAYKHQHFDFDLDKAERFFRQLIPNQASKALYALKPVTFHYKNEIDPAQTLDFGLVAEEVAVDPELAVRDWEGKISNYRRDAINAMLLNEFLKEHRKVEEMEKGMAALTAQLKQQAAQIQKVRAQIEMVNPAPQVVWNKTD